MTPPPHEPAEEEPSPPLMGSWRNLYLLVLASLAVQVLVLWLITQAYA